MELSLARSTIQKNAGIQVGILIKDGQISRKMIQLQKDLAISHGR